MISRLNPLSINIAFPRKTYYPGDIVSLIIDLTSRANVTIREARISLECQMRYSEVRSGISGTDAINRRNAGTDGMLGRPPQMVTRSVEVETSGTFDEQTFLTNLRLERYHRNSSAVALKVPAKLGGKTKAAQRGPWRIVVTADVSLARDVTESRRIGIALGSRETD